MTRPNNNPPFSRHPHDASLPWVRSNAASKPTGYTDQPPPHLHETQARRPSSSTTHLLKRSYLDRRANSGLITGLGVLCGRHHRVGRQNRSSQLHEAQIGAGASAADDMEVRRARNLRRGRGEGLCVAGRRSVAKHKIEKNRVSGGAIASGSRFPRDLF